METETIRLLQGDCRQLLAQLPSASVQLIVTSPPYADQRQATYGGVHPNEYVAWFLPIAAELHRVGPTAHSWDRAQPSWQRKT
jgi:site-specific DNA-methyltransferase (adenine-specific)